MSKRQRDRHKELRRDMWYQMRRGTPRLSFVISTPSSEGENAFAKLMPWFPGAVRVPNRRERRLRRKTARRRKR